jgi:hypothetical protein
MTLERQELGHFALDMRQCLTGRQSIQLINVLSRSPILRFRGAAAT